MNTPRAITLACPACHAPIIPAHDGSAACACGARYPSMGGAPSFAPTGGSECRDWYEHAAQSGATTAASVGYLSERHHRAMKRMFHELLAPLPSGALMLDAGCGHGGFARQWTQDNTVAGVDFALNMVALARAAGLEAFHADAKAMPFAPGQFDIVVSAEVSQYFEDIGPLLAEMTRVARPGGLVILSVPNSQSLARRFNRAVIRKLTNRFRLDAATVLLHSWDEIARAATPLPLDIEKVGLLYFPTEFMRQVNITSALDRRLASNFVVRFRKRS